MPKRPPPAERVPLTDEWGIYDPAKAGMQALYARLGRPVLRASSKSMRQERRRGFRPERPNDGVGLAIEEAMRRAGILIPPTPVDEPIVPGSAARAVRQALKAAKTAKEPKGADDVNEQAPIVADSVQELAPAAAPKRKTQRRAKTGAVLVPEPVAATPPVEIQAAPVETPAAPVETQAAPVETQAAAPAAEPEPPSKSRTGRKTAKARAKVESAPAVPPGPPPPSPRRPRGPVPLAAWAHAVADAPKSEPRRADRRGFWGALFRIPAEVALVEYAHGCRIHRLLIETSDVPSPELL